MALTATDAQPRVPPMGPFLIVEKGRQRLARRDLHWLHAFCVTCQQSAWLESVGSCGGGQKSEKFFFGPWPAIYAHMCNLTGRSAKACFSAKASDAAQSLPSARPLMIVDRDDSLGRARAHSSW
jgi:hypothetical protein